MRITPSMETGEAASTSRATASWMALASSRLPGASSRKGTRPPIRGDLLTPSPDRGRVGMEALCRGDGLDRVADGLEPFPGEDLHRGGLAEVVHVEARIEPRVPRGGEDMVCPDRVVPAGHRRVPSDEDGPRVPDPGEDREGILHLDGEVLGGDPVRGRHRLVQVLHEDVPAVLEGLREDLLAGFLPREPRHLL